MEKFEMGPLQKEWVKSLREHPERQGCGWLAEFSPDGTYKACCLGQLYLCHLEDTKTEPLIEDNLLTTIHARTTNLNGLHEDFGLLSGYGQLKYEFIFSHNRRFISLAAANDNGIGWVEIADFIESHPDWAFTKSV